VGDHHENFSSGDLVLIGPGLPHTWVSDNSIKGKLEAVVIQFTTAFIDQFTAMEELAGIRKLLLQANQGSFFITKNATVLIEQIKGLPDKKTVEKITGLLTTLHELSKLKSTALASSFYQPLKGKENESRINKVCQFVQKNASEHLTIHKAAALIHLSPGAFCKFFKRITGKTFSDYVNDIRIANVCNQLMATDKQVAEIAYSNGFETITYFNRMFLKKKGVRPGEYRRQVG
jgi:AraC-like DNA-binding protein